MHTRACCCRCRRCCCMLLLHSHLTAMASVAAASHTAPNSGASALTAHCAVLCVLHANARPAAAPWPAAAAVCHVQHHWRCRRGQTAVLCTRQSCQPHLALLPPTAPPPANPARIASVHNVRKIRPDHALASALSAPRSPHHARLLHFMHAGVRHPSMHLATASSWSSLIPLY